MAQVKETMKILAVLILMCSCVGAPGVPDAASEPLAARAVAVVLTAIAETPAALFAAAPAVCPPPPELTPIPDDGLDDRAAIQAQCACGLVDLRGRPGRYDVITPAQPRAIAVLTMPPGGCEVVGDGEAVTSIMFGGHTGAILQDWRGWQVASGAKVHGLAVTSNALVVDNQNEQTHLFRMDGEGVRLDANGKQLATTFIHLRCDHLGGGDCLQVACYDPIAPLFIDRRCFALELGYITGTASRSIVAVHSGLHGCNFHHFSASARDQIFDFEGSGGTTDCEIHHNTALVAAIQQSSIFADINNLTRLHFHHNTSAFLGVQIYGCTDCEFDHDVITQAVPNSAAVVAVLAANGLRFHDEIWTRNQTLVNAPVLSIARHGSAVPTDLLFDNVKLYQHASWTGANVVGANGVTFDHVTYVFDGGAPARIALNAEAAISRGVMIYPTTNIVVRDSTFTSAAAPLYAGITIGATVGPVTVTDTTIGNATRSMTCGAGAGPTTYADDTMLALPISCNATETGL